MLINQTQYSHQSVRYNSNMTINTVDSMPDLNNGPQLWFKVFFITSSIISALIGILLLYNKTTYLPSQIEFTYITHLSLFIYIYSFGSLSALIIGSIVAGIIVFCINLFRLCHFNKDTQLHKQTHNNDNDLSNRSSYSTLNGNDDASCINYAFVLFIIVDIVMYYSAVPFSIFLIVKMIKMVSDVKRFAMVFGFLGVNMGIGIVFVSVSLFSVIGAKVTMKKNKYIVFDEDVERVQQEVKEAYKEFNQDKKQPDMGIEMENMEE